MTTRFFRHRHGEDMFVGIEGTRRGLKVMSRLPISSSLLCTRLWTGMLRPPDGARSRPRRPFYHPAQGIVLPSLYPHGIFA
jgi:hypothetical protein